MSKTNTPSTSAWAAEAQSLRAAPHQQTEQRQKIIQVEVFSELK